MPPKKKKQAKNAFYYFLVEFREEALRNGRNIESPTFDEEADREWRNLSPTKRFYYEDIAAEKRRKMDSLENKFTTTGVSYAQLQREEMERTRQEELMIHEIESTVRSLTGNTLKTKVFHFIHVNTYCRLLDGHFLPCEIGIAKFTFENGVKDCYHTIINLECIPTGYFLECQKNSEETHQIPLPPDNNLGEWDSEKILVQIEAFLADNEVYPPVYTLQSNIEAAQDTLTTFASGRDTFRVYPIAKLLFELRNACANEAGGLGFPVLSLAEREFEKDFFNLSPGISCFYHEGMDACQYCSLSIVKRWCFLFASLGCPDLGVALKPGSHKPRKITLPPAPPEPMTSKTQVSLRKGKKGAQVAEPPPITIIDYGSSKVITEYSDGGRKSSDFEPSPLAQFGTYIRATAEEISQEDTPCFDMSTSQMTKYPVHYNNKTMIAGGDTHFPEKNLYFSNESNAIFSPTKTKQHYQICKPNDQKLTATIVIQEPESKQYPSPQTGYNQISLNDSMKTKQLRSQPAELYSQFVYDVQDSISQTLEPSSEQPRDVFDIYIDSMFQPIPIQQESSNVNVKNTTLGNYPAPQWNDSHPSVVGKQNKSSFSAQTKKPLSPALDISIGHGRSLNMEPGVCELAPARPGRDNCNIVKTSSTPISSWEMEEHHSLENGFTSMVRMPGRGRGRARGLSLLLELNNF